MLLGSNFAAAEATGGFKNPEAKGYKFVILKIEDAVSKKGNNMLVFYVDITEGEFAGHFEKYPKRQYITYDPSSAEGMGRVKATLTDIINDNKARFPIDPLAAGDQFNEQLLVGCTIGGVLKWDDENPKYLNLNYLTSYAKAMEVKPTPQPAIIAAPVSGIDDDLPF